MGGEAGGPFPWAGVEGAGTPTWIVDPLDGTTNFVTGQNDVVVSIACWSGIEPSVGVIFNPFLNEMYTAIAGHGALCNGKPIHVGQESDLSKVVVMNNVGASRDLAFVSASARRIERVLAAGVRGLRLGGSCAMNMCTFRR
jgi:fructose-1,6-bisphosphatase/inositol monophosphatase family enzyme